MNILVVGLGLIGGSLCKALKKYTDNTIIGLDTNKSVEQLALSDKSIDYTFSENYEEIELKSGTVITDVCGIKGDFAERINDYCNQKKLKYVGIHPMAGREVGGYKNSSSELFKNANFIITPFENSDKTAVKMLKELSIKVGAKKLVVTTPYEHDKMIAYTSQLAHVVSSAYVKSPVIEKECGYSGGSFQDMTRIATMKEDMWSTLFLQNRDNLLEELNILINNLQKYSKVISENNKPELMKLIKEGRIIKEANLKKRIGEPN